MSNEMLTKEELTIWQLEELAAADEIDCDEIEILGEDVYGNEGFCTVKIADIAKNALSLMKDTAEKHEAELQEKQVELLREAMNNIAEHAGFIRDDDALEDRYHRGGLRYAMTVIQDKIKKLEGK